MKFFFILAINEIRTAVENLTAENSSFINKFEDRTSNDGTYKHITNQNQLAEDCCLMTHEGYITSDNVTNFPKGKLSEQVELTKTKSSTFVIIENSSDTFNNSDKFHDCNNRSINSTFIRRSPSFKEYFKIFKGKTILMFFVYMIIILPIAFYYYLIKNDKKVYVPLFCLEMILPTIIIIGAIISGRKDLKEFK